MAQFGPGDFRSQRYPRLEGENLAKNLAIVDVIAAIAAEKGIATAQVALAWLLQKGDDVVAIPGTKRVKWLEQNVGAAAVALTQTDMERLQNVSLASGARYSDMSSIDA